MPGLMIGHMIAARIIPELQIEEEEAQQLAEAICNYLRHTKIKLDPKTRDFYALLMCAGMLYFPRVMAASNRVAAVRAARKRGENENVVPINPENPLWQMPTSSR